jgi:hypothetical protein
MPIARRFELLACGAAGVSTGIRAVHASPAARTVRPAVAHTTIGRRRASMVQQRQYPDDAPGQSWRQHLLPGGVPRSGQRQLGVAGRLTGL